MVPFRTVTREVGRFSDLLRIRPRIPAPLNADSLE